MAKCAWLNMKELGQTAGKFCCHVDLHLSEPRHAEVVKRAGDIARGFGNFHHDEIIGRSYGSKVRSRKGRDGRSLRGKMLSQPKSVDPHINQP